MGIPTGAVEIVRALSAAGYEAYLVGGCVRDMLLAETAAGIEAHDWDICTNARPDEMKAVFAGRRTVGTGLKHGTITVLAADGRYEVTTYRIDGTYSDGRRPDSVTFTANIAEDLSRRDFTINAMAMSLNGDGGVKEIVDPFGGRKDLASRLLRCVGDPSARFEEDALRILRALRFAGRLGLAIDPAAKGAMLEKRALLRRISAERSMDELGKILLTDRGWDYLRTYHEILTELLPEMLPCVGFAQNNPWHCHTVFDHIMYSVGFAPKDLTLRMTMLLHDIGKPAAASTDENGVDHFFGHSEKSAGMAEEIMRRLRCSNRLTRDVVELVRYHDTEVKPLERTLRRLLNKLGAEQLKRLFQVKRADLMAQSAMARERKRDELDQSEALLERLLAQGQAFTLKDLAIGGEDLLARGIQPGPEVGARLQRALDAVLDGTAENEKEALLRAALGIRPGENTEKP